MPARQVIDLPPPKSSVVSLDAGRVGVGALLGARARRETSSWVPPVPAPDTRVAATLEVSLESTLCTGENRLVDDRSSAESLRFCSSV